MKKRIAIIAISVVLLFVGFAGAQQVLLPGTLIPKFVDPLPVAGDITVVDATQILGFPDAVFDGVSSPTTST